MRLDGSGSGAEFPGDFSGGSHGHKITFDGEEFAFQRRNRDSGEGLQRMHRADGGAILAQRLKKAGIERAAGVQHDVPAQFLGADASEFGGDARDLRIRNGDENHRREENAAGQSGFGLARTDEAHGTSGAGLSCA